ncbi:MAG: methyl-accepting chemotaxis protein, partial [Pseudomonas sp.]
MNRLIVPGVRLLDRLRLRGKFAVLSLFILLPIVLASGLLVAERDAEIQRVESQLAGLQPLRQSLDVLSRLQALHDLNVALRNRQAVAADQGQLQPLLSAALASLAALRAPWQEADSAAAFLHLRDQLVEDVGGVVQLPYGERQSRLQQVLGQAPQLLELAASGAGLTQNYSPQIRQQVDLLGRNAARVRALTGQGRAIGAQVLALGQLQGSNNDQLDSATVDLEGLVSEWQALATTRALPGTVSAALHQAIAGLTALAATVQQDVLEADTLSTAWPDYFAEQSSHQQQALAYEPAVLASLEQQLQQERAASQQRMLLQGGLVAGALGLVLYLYAAFYSALRAALSGLGRTLEDLAAGDLTVQYQGRSRDEVQALGQVLNRTLARVRQLIAEGRDIAAEVDTQAQRVQQVAGASSEAMSRQRERVEHVATAMQQMTATAQEVARNAVHTADGAASANVAAAQGRAHVGAQSRNIQQLADGIHGSAQSVAQLVTASTAIGHVLGVIKGIA